MNQIFYPAYADKIFHTGKAGNVYQLDSIKKFIAIKEKLKLNNKFNIITVNTSDESILNLAHSDKLLNAYKTGLPLNLAEISGIQWNSDFYWRWLVNKSWVGVKAATYALINEPSLALQDGGHHAEFDRGFGFNPINTLMITANQLIKSKTVNKVAIFDLDVHYGNGTHSLALNNQNILSTDIWKYKLDKWQYTESRDNIFHFKIEKISQYWDYLEKVLTKINDFNPDIVLYYMGLDVLENDSKGGIENFDTNQLLKRENIVSDFFKNNSIKYCMFIGGGYVNYNQSKDNSKKNFDKLIDLYLKSINIHFN